MAVGNWIYILHLTNCNIQINLLIKSPNNPWVTPVLFILKENRIRGKEKMESDCDSIHMPLETFYKKSQTKKLKHILFRTSKMDLQYKRS